MLDLMDGLFLLVSIILLVKIFEKELFDIKVLVCFLVEFLIKFKWWCIFFLDFVFDELFFL